MSGGKRLLVRFGPSLFFMIGIFYASSRTGDDLDSWLPYFQKLFPAMEGFNWGHFISYFVLSLTYLWALAGGRPSLKHKLGAILLCILYGITDEFHQRYVPGRTSDIFDLRNDGIGASLAMLAVSWGPLLRLYQKLPHARKY